MIDVLLVLACVLAMAVPYFIMTGIYRAELKRSLVPVRARAQADER